MEMEVVEQVRGGGAESLANMRPGSTVSLAYHPDFGPHEELVLLEVDDSILPHFLHNRMTIRGQIDEDAVLCRPSSTYALKFVGTSNSAFIIPPGDSSTAVKDSESGKIEVNGVSNSLEVVSVLKVAPGNMEIVQVAPKLDKLNLLLSERPYKLEDDEDMELETGNIAGLYRWEDLTNIIQASDEELMEGLKAISAIEINGFWRNVDENTMDQVMKMILSNSIIHDWSLKALTEDVVLSILEADGFPRRIVHHCLSVYGTEASKDGCCIWSLDEKKLSVRYATQILKRGKMKLENFMEKWASSLPAEVHPDLHFLEGEVLYDKIGIETWIRPFSVSTLPSNPAERFTILFRERPKWEGKDLQPYIRDLRIPGLSAESLLIKYTRRTQPAGDIEPIFSAR